MKKIILHLGLPKTATTTLQHHLFQKLHDDGKINFLGKVIDFDENNNPTWRNDTGHIIRNACEGKIGMDISSELDAILRDDMLNVYSDEGIMVCYPGLQNLSLEEKLSNLQIILKDYDVRVLISLRNPIDYFYSLYVQLFPDFYYQDKTKNTFEKYIDLYMADRENILYESFHYSTLLEMIFSKFDTKVILFENMKFDIENFYKEISDLLDLEVLEIDRYLSNKHENKKKKENSGMYSCIHETERTFVGLIRSLLPNNTIIYRIAKEIYNLKFLQLDFFDKKKYTHKEIFHEKPTSDQIDRLNTTLLLNDDFKFDRFNLDKEKLKKYGYVKCYSNTRKKI